MYVEALVPARSVANEWVENMINITSGRALSGVDNPLITLDLVTRTARDLHRAGWYMQTSQALIGTIRVLGRIGDHEGAAIVWGAMRASPAAQFIRQPRLLADAATQLTSALGAERFAALAAQGEKLDVAQLLALLGDR